MPIVLFVFLFRRRDKMKSTKPAVAKAESSAAAAANVVQTVIQPVTIQIEPAVVQRPARASRYVASYGILFEAFHSSAYWWQSLILFRRVVLAAISIIDAANVRFLCFTLATFAFFLLHNNFRPYREKGFNTLEALVLICHTILAAILSGFAAQSQQLPTGVTLFLFISLPAIALLLFVAFNTVQSRLKAVTVAKSSSAREVVMVSMTAAVADASSSTSDFSLMSSPKSSSRALDISVTGCADV